MRRREIAGLVGWFLIVYCTAILALLALMLGLA